MGKTGTSCPVRHVANYTFAQGKWVEKLQHDAVKPLARQTLTITSALRGIESLTDVTPVPLKPIESNDDC